MKKIRRVTLKDIATETGLSVAAVSKSLRGLGDISLETQERVQAVAARMGYQRDAALSALAAYRNKIQDRPSDWNAVAFLHNWPDLADLERHVYYRPLIESLREELTSRGFDLEIHSVGSEGEALASILRRLKHRGVHALILGPLPPTHDPKPILVDSGDFEVMTLGPSAVYAQHHTVQVDYWENFQLLWRELRARSYSRIGFYLPQHTVWRTGGAWLGGFLVHQNQDRQVGPIPPLLHEKEDKGAFFAWFRKYSPDAIISISAWPVEWLRSARIAVPKSVGVALASVADTNCSGIDAQPEQQGQSVAEMAEILLHQRSIRIHRGATPLRMHIAGVWKEGTTVRALPVP
jgi:DNA-binding LacI/PurR family transcriptional regulator